MSRSRAIGTAFASQVIRYLRAEGFGQAELRNLAGRYDLGDIVGIPGVVIECKGGKHAEIAAGVQIEHWLDETEIERRNARAEVGLLVVKRKGAGSARVATHDVYLRLWALLLLTGSGSSTCEASLRPTALRIALGDATRLLRAGGYGDELGAAS